MIERIIENWLINSTERSFTIPFCQVLASEGYQILHVSAHGVAEHGKDIIARDQDGIACGFQLKTGDIKANEWRNIHGEITELVETAISFPGIDSNEERRAVLVTNGDISENVRLTINDLNAEFERRNLPCLEFIGGGQLYDKFLNAQGSFLPHNPMNMKDFLELYLSSGKTNLDKEKCSKYIKDTLFNDEYGTRETDLKRRITGTFLLVKYLLLPYEKVGNHIAILEYLIILCSHILALVEKHDLNEDHWRPSIDLCIHAIRESLDNLRDEVVKRNNNYLEGDILGDGGDIYKARTTIVLGWLAGNELFRHFDDESYRPDAIVLEIIKRNWPSCYFLFSEGASVYFLTSAILSSLAGDKELASEIYKHAIIEISNSNNSLSDNGLIDPYYSVDQVLAELLNTNSAGTELGTFTVKTYTLKPLIECMVREGQKEILSENWRDISYTNFCEFDPEPVLNNYFWISETGSELFERTEIPQSWSQLREKAFSTPDRVPSLLKDNRKLVPLFLLTYPHRLRSDLIKLIDHNFVEQT